MFTGIIQDIGRIEQKQSEGQNINLMIFSEKLTSDIKIGDSIAVSGICLTATKINFQTHHFFVTAVAETIIKSALSELKQGDEINLELAMKPSDHLGGHFVQGHVDTVGICKNINKQSGSWLVRIQFPSEYSQLVIEKGSIAINGVSLTCIDVGSDSFSVSVIPHTWQETTLAKLKTGSRVNLEFDLLGKYILKQTQSNNNELTIDKIRSFGF